MEHHKFFAFFLFRFRRHGYIQILYTRFNKVFEQCLTVANRNDKCYQVLYNEMAFYDQTVWM